MKTKEMEAGTVRDAGNWKRILEAPVFNELDRRLARFVADSETGESRLAPVAAGLVSFLVRRGHVFADLAESLVWDDPSEGPEVDWPDFETWKDDLGKSSAVGGPGAMKPLILTDSGKLYLQRYWFYEKLLADGILEKASLREEALPEGIAERLEELFGEATDQKVAAENALRRSFSVISGGPGTGKTTTVAKILVLLLEERLELSIQLVAPTGKAAARLQESIRGGMERIRCAEEVRERLRGMEASTIHRMLGAVGGSVYFRHDARNPLPVDVVVLDEASMVDLPLMAKLIDALPGSARLIVLGDKDQLASVEAGSVLSGIVEAAEGGEGRGGALAGAATLLRKNYRFGNESGIFRVCNAIREGDAEETMRVLRDERFPDVEWRPLPEGEGLKEGLRALVLAGLRSQVEARDPAEALAEFGRFQVLCALRKGIFGKGNLNALVEEILREEGLVVAGRENFPGRALMVTENDYGVRLFNGDIGVLLPNGKGQTMAYFAKEDGGIREISPLRLPATEPAFAMTIHKSQGSEFDEVLVVLPGKENRILTRELLYTAISRARKKAVVWSTEEMLRATVSRRISRGSALPEMLSRF